MLVGSRVFVVSVLSTGENPSSTSTLQHPDIQKNKKVFGAKNLAEIFIRGAIFNSQSGPHIDLRYGTL